MKKKLLITGLFCFRLITASPLATEIPNQTANLKGVTFTENKGQVSDQFFNPRPDVLFSGSDSKLAFHIKKSGISYQLNEVGEYTTELNPKTRKPYKTPSKITIYRIDINWLNCNQNFSVKHDQALEGYNNYYSEVCPNGVQNVRIYKGVTLKNIYHNIDLHYYEKKGSLKYDFIVAPNTDYKKIQLQVKGAVLLPQADGSLLLKTPMGNVQENAPIVYQNNKQLPASWNVNGDVISFNIKGYDARFPLIIDPITRLWGTYYGGTSQDIGWSSDVDALGNLFVSGTCLSTSAIATVGSHQVSISGSQDAYLVKFNSAGVRQWCTYYGGTGVDHGFSCATDASGNVYMTGQTTSTGGTAIASAGSHQTTHNGGSSDSYFVKFNTSGVRQWGTYYGGSGGDYGGFCATDPSGNVYMGGYSFTNIGTAIATAGSHKATGDANGDGYLVKFNAAGVRQWGTYYGGSAFDAVGACATDASGNVFITGQTESIGGTNIATVGSHQPSFGGSSIDCYLAMFNSAGVRQWATYYGGNGDDIGNSVCTDVSGNIYMAGYAGSTNGTSIATAGSHQTTHGGGIDDGFVAKFNSAGVRQWGTYYGGNDEDYAYNCVTDVSGNIYINGAAGNYLVGVVATTGNHQTLFGGGISDTYLAQFNTSGVRQWGSYYGGSGNENGHDLSVDASFNIYLVGSTSTSGGTSIATIGSHQIAFGGGSQDAFIAKFSECPAPAMPSNVTNASNQNICINSVTTLSASGTGTLNWYASLTSSVSLGTGTSFSTPSMTVAGTFTYYAAGTNTCSEGDRAPITITVNAIPVITVNSGSICTGQSFTIVPSGASTYTISGGSAIVSPTSNATYTITGSSSPGCNSATGAVSGVSVNPLPVVSATSNNSMICSGQTATLTASGATSYTWNTSSTNTIIAVSPTTTTSYTVAGTDANGCENNFVVTQNVQVCTDISSNSLLNAQAFIYPNPFGNVIYLQTSQTGSDIQVFNSLGQKLLTATPTKTHGECLTEINLTGFAPGVYYIKSGNTILKAIKQH